MTDHSPLAASPLSLAVALGGDVDAAADVPAKRQPRRARLWPQTVT